MPCVYNKADVSFRFCSSQTLQQVISEFSSVVQSILISVEVFGWNDNLHARPLMPQSGLRSSGVEQWKAIPLCVPTHPQLPD